MKKILCTVGLAALLTACGGGGSASNDSSGGGNNATITDPTSNLYKDSLKAFAETWTSLDFMWSLHDPIMFGMQSGNCPQGGSLSFTNITQTMDKCVRNYPADNAYSGTYTAIGDAANLNITSADVRVLEPGTFTQQFRYTGAFKGGVTSSGKTDTTTVKDGTASFAVGASTYMFSAVNTSVLNDGKSTITTTNSGATSAYSLTKGFTTYKVDISEGIKILDTSRPSAGSVVLTFASGSGCSPLKIRFISASQFGMTCTSEASKEVVINWDDTTVKTALADAHK